MSPSASSVMSHKRPLVVPAVRTAVLPSVLASPVERPKTDWRTVILVNLVSLTVHGLILGACALIVLDRETIEEIFTTLALSDDAELEPIVEQSLLQPEKLEDDRE